MEEKRPKQMSVAKMLRSINSYKGENPKLRNRVKELQEIQKALCDKNNELRTERDNFEQKYVSAYADLQDYLALPWYKKIFVK